MSHFPVLEGSLFSDRLFSRTKERINLQYIKVAKSSDLGEGEMIEVVAKGSKILLAKAGDKFYAAQGRCPHMGGTLAEGTLEGTVVTCPFHDGQFDLTDGRIIKWAPTMPSLTPVAARIGKLINRARPLRIYPVKVDGDDILVGI
jgi:3-phenylpropionate/trans-cinnamate dioxygenase ferredoxin subunit